ncbi:hypothetical protein BRYFOR_06698 [Marvinbryantia formatexigens DSM 14469]|uniref:Uncharacterized protein n=1 Tax=Marvinbryantia formatexigens DSM 14469 TaxID=478749 RepID=C6LD40_9FIRM|nr:putative ABC transporter permease [Marvinbryantia formatexigens]EET61523.1 hypothetical protein BRYFOR_06698 [Marvinbryantia formatexigens DSM 14469]UWO26171.1 putative ABC transporter permease [Marvinbryantia formatexigens DSM 14469]SDF93256.1 Putative ABC-transporter type IV [Marvinbryantia formatexigens]
MKTHGKIMLLYLVFLFVTISVAGWCAEVAFRSVFCRKLVIPGFLYGPYCPIYGFGVVAVTLFCNHKKKWVSFLEIFVLASLLEYVVSFTFERVFHVLLWDYSMIPFSIGTRVSPLFSLIWGFFGVIALTEVEPRMRQLYQNHRNVADIGAVAGLSVIAADAVIKVAGF